ncbi:MAG TPA: hypothetical protein VLT88_09345, partial [Desulfosarcina sp.]|nr:hypothetical protein [Desulfosarcina sp.]
ATAFGLLVLGACAPTAPLRQSTPLPAAARLGADEQIAGEIMAYLLEVVLGEAGALEKRRAWATRGLDLPLDFDMVYERMFGPVPLRSELMVLDTNILGISQVLYHYDRRMNLFKGQRDHDSLFPCAELMAIRLLLLQKLHRNEKVSVAALIRHANLFIPGSRDASVSELAAMQLDAGEFAFLKAVFQSEPVFMDYLRHPFVVSSLKKIGVAEEDAATQAADRSATYRQLACPPTAGSKPTAITVAILPAMVPMFETVPGSGEIRPTVEYDDLQTQLQAAIRNGARAGLDSAVQGRLAFYSPNRPLTIHPGNAEQVVGQLCPFADFTVILLGKNVYRAMHIDPRTDIYPHKNILYLDVDDVRYRQIDQEIDAIISALASEPVG